MAATAERIENAPPSNRTRGILTGVKPSRPAAPSADDLALEHRPLGELLVEQGIINPDQLEMALSEQRQSPAYLGVILMRHKWVDEREVYRQLSRQRGIAFYDVRDREIPSEVVDKLPRDVALKHRVLPVGYEEGILRVAMEDPLNERLLDSLRRVIPDDLQPGFTTRGDLHFALNRAYNNLVRSNPLVRDFFDGFAYLIEQPSFDANRLIDLALALSHLLGASDIHLQFSTHELKIALRIDGALHGIPVPARRVLPEHLLQLRNALKIRAGMDPSRRGVAQDGRIDLEMEQGAIQARIALLPLVDGEKMALRLVGRLELRDFDQIGLFKSDRELLLTALKRPSGLILVTGPTRSGRTTTLYALLSRIPTAARSVVTIEDPVEARLGDLAQMQIDPERGLTYDAALVQVMRQDPDVIMLGDLRDPATAAGAVEAALTGHQMLAAMLFDGAAGAVLRLINMNVDPLALAGALDLVIAQRLMPRICEKCRTPHPDAERLAKALGLAKAVPLWTGAGCAHCYFTGRSGRLAIFETMPVTDELRDVISSRPSLTTLLKAASTAGGRSFRADALEKCLKGLLAPEEVLGM